MSFKISLMRAVTLLKRPEDGLAMVAAMQASISTREGSVYSSIMITGSRSFEVAQDRRGRP